VRCNNICHPNGTPRLTIDEPINLIGNGIRTKQVLCGYEDLSRAKDSWGFEKKVSRKFFQIMTLMTRTKKMDNKRWIN
jgi:hypothetical protein